MRDHQGLKMMGLVVLLSLTTIAARAETWRWVDGNGTVSFSDTYNDIPARYRSQAKIVDESQSYNVMPGNSSGSKVRFGAASAAKGGATKAKGPTDAKKTRKSGAPKPVKPRKHRRQDDESVSVPTTPARQAQDRVEEQLRLDRQKLDNNQSPARRAMERNEEQIRKTKESISGH
jgi:hypothetical protein